MKNLILSFVLTAAFGIANAQDFPQPSPWAETEQMVGLTKMEIEYSRPGMKDRKIFGDLVPNDQIWRTGANSPTKISFSNDVSIDGQTVEKGTYSIFTVPAKDNIKVIFNSDVEAGVGDYDSKNDVAAIGVRFEDAKDKVERMRFTFENVEDNSVDLVFNWAGKTFSVPVTVDTPALVEARMAEKLKEKDLPFTFYNAAAGYYMDKNPKKAVEWAEKSTGMKAHYWNVITLAQAYVAVGNKDAAIKAAQWGKKLALESGADYYVKLNDEIIAKMQ